MKNIHLGLSKQPLELSKDVGPRKKIRVKNVIEPLSPLDIDNYADTNVLWINNTPYRIEII